MISTKMLMKAERFFIKARTVIRETILSAELTGAEFVPFIQPVCKGDEIVGGEVLLRVLKDGIYQSPEKYLSAMESCEVINDVTCSLMLKHFSKAMKVLYLMTFISPSTSVRDS